MASGINTVGIIGRLTREAELKYTEGGYSICNFSIANNYYSKKDPDAVNFFDVTLFGKQGPAIMQYLVKGKRVGIQGELRQERWTDQSGNRSKVKIIANHVELLDGGDTKPRESFSAKQDTAQFDEKEAF